MVQNHSRMRTKMLRQHSVQLFDLFPVNRRSHAMVMPEAMMVSHTLIVHPHCLRIFRIQPGRSCPGGCGKNRINSVLIKVIDYFFQPFKMKFSLSGFRKTPPRLHCLSQPSSSAGYPPAKYPVCPATAPDYSHRHAPIPLSAGKVSFFPSASPSRARIRTPLHLFYKNFHPVIRIPFLFRKINRKQYKFCAIHTGKNVV